MTVPELKLRSIDRVLEDIARVDPDLHRRLQEALERGGEDEVRRQILEELRVSGLNDRAIEALVNQLKKKGP